MAFPFTDRTLFTTSKTPLCVNSECKNIGFIRPDGYTVERFPGFILCETCTKVAVIPSFPKMSAWEKEKQFNDCCVKGCVHEGLVSGSGILLCGQHSVGSDGNFDPVRVAKCQDAEIKSEYDNLVYTVRKFLCADTLKDQAMYIKKLIEKTNTPHSRVTSAHANLISTVQMFLGSTSPKDQAMFIIQLNDQTRM